MTTYYSELESPVGTLLLSGDGTHLAGVFMQDQKYAVTRGAGWQRADAAFAAARAQLTAYFAGSLRAFELALAPQGSPFQQKVWRALLEIPYGRTESYGALARRIGTPQAARAVGLANGHNPIGIIIPCHRVIGANGALTGYGGGLPRKRWLLAHEATHAPGPRELPLLPPAVALS